MRTTTVSAGRTNLWAYIVVLLLAGCGGNPDVPSGVLDVDGPAGGGSGSGNGGGAGGGTTVSGDTAAGGPVAEIQASATVGFAPLTVRFSAVGSRAAAGRIAEYAWDFDDGQTGDAAELFHTFTEPGLYAVELTVLDERGGSGRVELAVAVLPPVEIACSPAAARGVAPLRVQFGVTTMAGALHVPVDVQYHWDFGDGTAGQGPNVVRVYERPGRYTVTLALVVGALTLRGDQMVVTVDGPAVAENRPPAANAGPDQVVVDVNGDGVASVLLDGRGSHDPDGQIVWYRWSVATGPEGDGIVAQGKQATSQVSLAVGQHEITLTVTDDQQATGQDKVRVAVVARAALAVTPNASFTSVGAVGGSFSPGQMAYTLRNAGQQALEWSASTGQGWLAVSPSAGSLAGGKSAQVTAVIKASPAALGAGVHRDTLTFTNRTNDVGTTTRAVELTVTDPALPLISGRVAENGGAGVGDVVLAGLPDDPKSDSEGYYVASVPVGWSGTVTPTKAGYTFDPENREYASVTADQPDQNYTATPLNVQWADHVSQYGITWTFDKPYRVGQFVNGDWWVCPDTPEGSVLVTDITRPHRNDPEHELDGSQMNPTVAAQGYDSREASSYSSVVNVALSLPLALAANQSLVSSISWVEGEPGCPPVVNGKPRPVLKVACVLTCLGTAPPADAFRPSAYGDDKALHQTGAIQWGRLPSLAPVASTPTLASVEAKFEKFRLDQIGTYSPVEFLHPSEAMPWYGATMCKESGDAALRLCLDDTPEQKLTLLVRYVQYGIDLHGAARTGTRWRANGGHGPGRKLPILFAGLVLDDENMLAIGADYPASGDTFAEDAQTWFVDATDVGRVLKCTYSGGARGGTDTTVTLAAAHPSDYPSYVQDHRIYLVGGTGAGQVRVATGYDIMTKVATVAPWDTVPDATTRYEIRGYEADMVGTPEWGIRHFGDYPNMDDPSWYSPYRSINGNALMGHVLVARIAGLKTAWDHDAFFDYQDRYFELTAPNGPYAPRATAYLSAFAAEMWEAYRGQY